MSDISNDEARIHHLVTRNVSEIIQREELEQQLKSGKTLKVYLGVDPSGPEIHLGHAVVLWKLREFQDLGHEVILLIGDFTAQIGDPTGKSKERPPLTAAEVQENARDYQKQAAQILRFEGENAAHFTFNSEWLKKLTFDEVIHLAANFTVQQMIERDMFQERLKKGNSIGLHEFLYPLMVGYDSVMLDVDVEVGGNDQLFNIKAGRTLMEKLKHKSKVVLTTDLLIGSDGSKMSKSTGNIIPITAKPNIMYGQLMAVADSLIEEYALLCSDMSDEEVRQVGERLKKGENPRDVKLDIAERIVARYSSAEIAAEAREQFLFMFSKSENYQGMPPVDAFFPAPVAKMPLYELVAIIASISRSEARRLIQAGGVDIDHKAEKDAHTMVDLENPRVIKIGKHQFVRVQHLDSPQK